MLLVSLNVSIVFCNGLPIFKSGVVFEAEAYPRFMRGLRWSKPKNDQHANHVKNKPNRVE
jgi:hypothetical protein